MLENHVCPNRNVLKCKTKQDIKFSFGVAAVAVIVVGVVVAVAVAVVAGVVVGVVVAAVVVLIVVVVVAINVVVVVIIDGGFAHRLPEARIWK